MLEKIILEENENSVAAFMAETIQGAGGCIEPPPEYWPIVREICTKHNVLLIVDEVMSGFARTGKMFAIEHYNTVPDIMTMAKGISASYLPFGAVAVNDMVYEGIKGVSLGHGTTFSGHPISAAASCATLDVYKKENVAENARKTGEHVLERLKKEFLPLPHVGNLGGKGLFQSIELVVDKETKSIPTAEQIAEIRQEGWNRGLFVRLQGGGGMNRWYIAPPATTTIAEVDEALDILLSIVRNLKW